MGKTHTHDFLAPVTSLFLYKERQYFLDTLGLLLSSGMDMLNALMSIHDETSSPDMKKRIQILIDEINNGSPFWKAMQKVKLFPEQTIKILKIGEETGRLPDNIQIIVTQQEKEVEFKGKLQSAMIYPGIVVMLIFAIGGGLSLFILPRLASIFVSLNTELPLLTKILIVTGSFMATYGWFVFPILTMLLCIAVYFLFFYSKTKIYGERLLFKIPGIKTAIQQIELSRFGFTLGSILDAGISIVPAMQSMRDASSFVAYREFYQAMSDSIDEGNSFYKSFQRIKDSRTFIPLPIQNMIVAAERSGKIPEVLTKIGTIYEKKADLAAKNISVALEPILLIIVSIGVFLLALAVVMPIYGLVGSVSTIRP